MIINIIGWVFYIESCYDVSHWSKDLSVGDAISGFYHVIPSPKICVSRITEERSPLPLPVSHSLLERSIIVDRDYSYLQGIRRMDVVEEIEEWLNSGRVAGFSNECGVKIWRCRCPIAVIANKELMNISESVV